MKQEKNVIFADEYKVLRRISDNWIAGKVVSLGYYYPPIGEPILEIPEHYEEIDEPLPEDETTEILPETAPQTFSLLNETEIPIEEPKKIYTIKDYIELEKRVEQLESMLLKQNNNIE